MHSTMETTLWVGLSISANFNYANIIEYIIKGGTEGDLLLIEGRYCTWKYPEEPIHAKTINIGQR